MAKKTLSDVPSAVLSPLYTIIIYFRTKNINIYPSPLVEYYCPTRPAPGLSAEASF